MKKELLHIILWRKVDMVPEKNPCPALYKIKVMNDLDLVLFVILNDL